MTDRTPETPSQFVLAEPEDVEAIYHLSRRGVGIQYESNGYLYSGTALQRICLGDLVAVDPEKYESALEKFLHEEYQDSLLDQPQDRLNIPLFVLFDYYDAETPAEVPSEPLQEAYFAQLDFLRQKGGSFVAAYRKDCPDWRTTVYFWDTLTDTARELHERGFDSEDLMHSQVASGQVLHHGMAVQQGLPEDSEGFYELIRTQFPRMKTNFPEETVTATLQETLEMLVEESPPSISLDAIALLREAEPDNKQYKKLAKQAKRRFHPLYQRDNYSQLTELGKAAASRLGIYDPVDLITRFARQQSELLEELSN